MACTLRPASPTHPAAVAFAKGSGRGAPWGPPDRRGIALRGSPFTPAVHRGLFRWRDAAAGPGTSLAGPETRDARLARLEAVLFLAGEPLTTRKIAQFAGLADGTEARTLIRRLNAMYDTGGQAFRVEEVAGGYQLLTRAMFGSWLRRLHQSPVELRLSSPALETLAVVAYRQPVVRAEIEAIRGVQCGEMLRQLMERDLVRISGRANELGRPFQYSTTRRFLQVFGLRHLDELPRVESLRSAAVPLPAGPEPHRTNAEPDSNHPIREEKNVTTATPAWRAPEELLELQAATLAAPAGNPAAIRAADEDEWEDDEGIEAEDDDDEDEDDDDDADDEDDLEDDEWEEVDDDDEELDEDDDEEWDDDEDDDWDDDEEDEDEDDEEWDDE